MASRTALGCLLILSLFASACNVYRVMVPSTHTDSVAPELPARLDRPALLVYTKTNGFRHGEAIDYGTEVIEEIAKRRGWSVFHTENGAVFNTEALSRFDVAVWHNASGDSLDARQKQAFRGWLEAGGGYVGTHAAGDSSHSWPFYVDQVIGAKYIGHPMGPQFQDATVIVEDTSHPASRHLPESFVQNDEWYSFEASPRAPDVHVLARLDESSYQPAVKMFFIDQDLRMGADHPLIWWRCVDRGRAIYAAFGHSAQVYESPEVQGFLEGAISWAAGLEGKGCR